MNYRIIATYIFLFGFFAFLGFAYFNYSKTTSKEVIKELSKEKKENKEEIEETVKKVIKENPELIIQSLESYQMKRMQEALVESGKKIQLHMAELENTLTDPRAGAKDSKIKIVEFFDYNCGYCKHMATTKAKIIEENPDIEYVFKELPILGEASVLAAKYALAVNSIDKDKYLAFHLALLNDNRQKTDDVLISLAGKVGVDVLKLKKAINDTKLNEIMQANQALARTVGLGGTPTYIVAGELIPGANYETITVNLQQARKKNNMPEPVKSVKHEVIPENQVKVLESDKK